MATLTPITVGRSTAPNGWSAPEVGTTPVMELITAAVDANLGRDNTNSTGSTDQGYLLNTVDSNFVSMDTVFIELRYRVSTTDPDLTIDSVQARIVRDSDGTEMAGGSGFVTIASGITNTSFSNSGAIQLTTINGSTNNKTDWDAARVELRWNRTRSMGGASIDCEISALSVTGTYTASYDPQAIIGGYHQQPGPIPIVTRVVPIR